MTDPKFTGRVGLQQRVMPYYRVPLFEMIGQKCPGGLSVFAGYPRPIEKIEISETIQNAQFIHAENWHLFSGGIYLCWQQNLMKWLSNWNPDVLIMEANPRYLATPGAIRWMHHRNRPVIGWGLGSPKSSGLLSGWGDQFRRKFIQSFDAIIAYSQAGADGYSMQGFPPDRIFVAPNAVVPAPVHTMPDRSGRVGRACVLFVGRLQERKRVDLLLNACASLPPELQPGLTIVGDGPDRSRLQKIAESIYPAAQFTGALTGLALDDHFNQADLFVLPGTGGLAVQQAMSFGLPIIVAEGDGTQSDLVRSGNGWQIKPGDLDDLRTTLAAALSDRTALNRMGEKSFRIVRDEINLEKMVDVFMTAITEVNRS